MESFSHSWLRLREPRDHGARAGALLERLRTGLGDTRPLQVLDFGAGSGSNLRYLAPRLANPQTWMLLDHDTSLLMHAASPNPNVWVCSCTLDLNEWGRIHRLQKPDLVTGSALLDLVSGEWIEALASQCSRWNAAVLFSLSVDGVIRLTPGDPDDALLLEALRQHQGRNKGLGQALGPDAAPALARALRERGYRVWLEPSPWILDAADADLSRALVEGWAAAASEQMPAEYARFAAWQARRAGQVAEGGLALEVGHWDLLALPPESGDGEPGDPGA